MDKHNKKRRKEKKKRETLSNPTWVCMKMENKSGVLQMPNLGSETRIKGADQLGKVEKWGCYRMPLIVGSCTK